MNEFSLDIKWIADFRSRMITVQYCPIFDGLPLSALSSMHVSLPSILFPENIVSALDILNVVAKGYAETLPVAINSISWQLCTETIERVVTEKYIGRDRDSWIEFNYKFTHSLNNGYLLKQRKIRRDEIPCDGIELIKRIDEYVCENAHIDWVEKYNSLSKNENTKLYLPPPINIFLSYRKDRDDVKKYVRRINDELSLPSRRTYLKVFYDEDDLTLGEWREQIPSKIKVSDVFIAVLTPSYSSGETSFWEFKKANEYLRETKKPEIVPLVIEGGFSDYSFIANRNGVHLPLQAELPIFKEAIDKLVYLITSMVQKRTL